VEGSTGGLTLEAVWTRVEALEQSVRQLEARVRELEAAGTEFRMALNRLGDALAATHDRPAMLSAVLETCALFLQASGAVFYGAVGGSDRLRPLAACGNAAPAESLAELRAGEGVAGSAATTGSVVRWPGPSDTFPSPDEPAAAPAGPGTGAAAAVAVPVRSGGRPFGVLALYGRSIDRPFTDHDVESLMTLVRQAETAIENTFLYEEAARLSITDGLTSLWNRREFDLRLAAELQRAVRFGDPFSVVLLDLDDFKPVNDRLGHQAGDALLIELAHRLSSGVRDVDVVARVGGDEFGLILPNTGIAGALRLAEKVRSLIGDEAVDLSPPHDPDGVRRADPAPTVRVAASIGVAAYPEHGKTGRELVAAADAALYRAKAGGGNRVEHAKVGR
jgi:two-component system cell cycle response regulator